ncbi:MAG: type II toxin-antitoxin system VapC family toxin [Vicinamibacterales bacterium]
MTLYLDTSSLVKLYVSEAGSGAVRDLVDLATVVATSSIAYTEARAALARRRRERTLAPRSLTAAKKALEADWPRYLAVDVTPALCRSAGDLAERYRLRAYDSVHLASFAEVVEQSGREVIFSSFDAALNAAAGLLARRLGARR